FLAAVQRAVGGEGETVGAVGVFAEFARFSVRRIVAQDAALGDRGKEHSAPVPGEAARRPFERAGDFFECPRHALAPTRSARREKPGCGTSKGESGQSTVPESYVSRSEVSLGPIQFMRLF